MSKSEELKNRAKEFPTHPGVYLMKNPLGKIIYVGKAKDLRARVRSYFNNGKDLSAKTRYLVNQIQQIEYVLTNTEVEAFLLEASLIKKHRPKYNIRLKDDKAYPYIRCSLGDPFPRFYLVRKVSYGSDVFFGPYTSGQAVRETIRFLNRTYKIRDCTDAFMKSRKRPCMTHQIGRCTAPCVELITKKEYQKDIKGALEFLRGHNSRVVSTLTRKMKKAAKEERFESAAKLRDALAAIEAILEKQAVVSSEENRDQDVVAYHSENGATLIETVHIRKGRVIGNRYQFFNKLDVLAEGEDPKEWMTSFLNQYYSENIIPDEIILPVNLGGDIEKLLQAVFKERQGKRSALRHVLNEATQSLMDMAQANAKSHFNDQVTKRNSRFSGLAEIQVKFKLPELPRRIECYDISNFQSGQIVASQVVFEDGVPKNEDYRRYRVRSVTGPNDFASLREVLARRLRHTEYDDPQLILVDGGKGQLSMAIEALKEVGRAEIPAASIAKSRTKGEFHQPEVEASGERFFLPGRQNPVVLSPRSEAYKILVQLRDEAHRFAISYHRLLRENQSLESELDSIRGLGEQRKKTLLNRFSNVEDIRGAAPEEIAELEGFSLKLAEDILRQLHQDSEAEGSEN